MSFSIAKQEMRKSQDNPQIKKKQFKDRKTLIQGVPINMGIQ